jgi:hypothetical protein
MLLITTFVELRVVAGRSRTGACRPHTVSGRRMLIHTCHAHAAVCRGRAKSLSERQGRGMACVNQTRQHCVNQMGKTQSKPLAARHDRGTAWYVWISLNSPSSYAFIVCAGTAILFCTHNFIRRGFCDGNCSAKSDGHSGVAGVVYNVIEGTEQIVSL